MVQDWSVARFGLIVFHRKKMYYLSLDEPKERAAMNDAEWKLIDRFKEPSSWSALAAGLSMLGITVPAPLFQGISMAGAAVCVLLGFFLKEKTNA